MIPGNRIDNRTVLSVIAYPDNLKEIGLEDAKLGGLDIEDSSEGLLDYVWTATGNAETGDVVLQREGREPVYWYNIGSSCKDLTLAFNQNMQPAIAWQDAEDNLWLRFYDSVSNTYATTSFGIGSCPRLTLDDKRPNMSATSDVIFGYLRETSLYYRQQRDAFQIERLLVDDVSPATQLRRLGMSGLQLQFELT